MSNIKIALPAVLLAVAVWTVYPAAAAPVQVHALVAVHPNIVVANFDGSSYGDGWTTTGTAFGSGPAQGTLPDQMTVSGYTGSGLVNSYLGGDSATGTLTSPVFTLQRHYLHFLIGGGADVSQESLDLLVNGKVVRSATGSYLERLQPGQWDIAELQGQQAELRITDSGTGSWGHILVDDIVQTDQNSNSTGDPIARAMDGVRQAIGQAAADPNRPVYHFHAPAQWMNDPNGFIYYQGVYHMFYQFNPYGSDWGNMHWGHAISKDLVNWQQLPIALWPSHERGEEYVFSGSVYPNAAGDPMAFYTSIAGLDSPRDPEVWAATPRDAGMTRWQKLPQEPVIAEPAQGPLHIDLWRDPYLVSDQGATYLVTGGALNGRGVVCLFQAQNGALTSWKYRGTLFQYPDSSVANVECPNLMHIGDKWVLLVSVHGQVEYFTGTADLKHCAFTAAARGVLNEGSYASQATSDAHGQCIEFAWVRPIGGPGWNGCLTLPSVLTVASNGALIGTPVSSLTSLRGPGTTLSNVALSGTRDLTGRVSGDTLEIIARIKAGTATEVGLRLRVSADGTRAITIRYNPATYTLSIPGFKDMLVPLDEKSGVLSLHLYLDRSLLDVYGDNGAAIETGAPSPTPQAGDQGVAVYANGGSAQIQDLTIFPLKAATFGMSHFH